MRPTARTAVAVIGIFLLLSVSPLEARRATVLKASIDAASAEAIRLDRVVRRLQRALEEDTRDAESLSASARRSWRGSGHLAERGRKAGWWCSSQKDAFVTRAEKLSRGVEALEDAAGPTEFAVASYTTLQARELVKTLDGAQRWGCSWVRDATIPKAPLQRLAAWAAKKNPCFAKGAAQLAASKWGTEEQQEQALRSAMALMLSESATCEPIDDGADDGAAAAPAGGAPGDADADGREEAEELEGALGGARKIPGSLVELATSRTKGSFIIVSAIVSGLATLLGLIAVVLEFVLALVILVLVVSLLYCLVRALLGDLLRWANNNPGRQFNFVGCARLAYHQTFG